MKPGYANLLQITAMWLLVLLVDATVYANLLLLFPFFFFLASNGVSISR